MKNNPFSLNFGKAPDRYVERYAQQQICDTLDSLSPSFNSFLITGVRGSGKSVLLSNIVNQYRDDNDWIVITLNPARDLLNMLAAALYNEIKLKHTFSSKEVNISISHVEVNIKDEAPASDIQISIERMIKLAADSGKRILLAIDDITKNKEIIAFSIAFQDLLMKNYPVFLLMTGLYENVYSIKTDKRCSFLLRAEHIRLEPLSKTGMKQQYIDTFLCSETEAGQMAALTKGYSFAFQVLGFIMWEKECSLEHALPYFDNRMAEYCYEKIWDDVPESERKILIYLAKHGTAKVRDILIGTEMESKPFSVFRDRLLKKGIVESPKRGELQLALPRFEIFLKEAMEYDLY